MDVRDSTISQALLRKIVTSGQLNLCHKGLTEIPQEIWNLEESIARDDDTKWWEFKELVSFDASSNNLSEISSQIVKFKDLKKFDAHDNQLTSIPFEFGQLINLCKIDLGHNKLESPLPYSLSNCNSLSVVRANHNLLRSTGFEEEIPLNLTFLDFSFNQLTSIPSSFGRLKMLTHLDISNNSITVLPCELGSCSNLSNLDASSNKIDHVPNELGLLSNLHTLNLGRNCLQFFPKLLQCHALKELTLSNNKLTSLTSSDLQNLQTVNTLLLNENKISKLPLDIDQLVSVAFLDLSSNDLSSLPERLGLLKNLKTLRLEGNPLRSIRQDILRGGSVAVLNYLKNRLPETELVKATIEETFISDSKILNYCKQQAIEIPEDLIFKAEDRSVSQADFSNNKLCAVPNSIQLLKHSLTSLSLAKNCFSIFPECIIELVNLKSLDFSANQLCRLPSTFNYLENLMELNLSINAFEQIPQVIYSMVWLETLLFADNKLTSLDAGPLGLQALTRLKALDVQNNCIGSVPAELGLCESLDRLNLYGNTFRRPAFADLQKGTRFVLNKLKMSLQ